MRFKPVRKPFNKNKKARHFQKRRPIRKKVFGTSERPRLVVFRSIKHIYGQLVDDSNKKTLTTVSSHSKELREALKKLSDKSGAAKIVGRALAAKAKSMNITQVTFDRNGYFYQGRVKWLAEGAREGGLLFLSEKYHGA
jgi:large subunit ribosomal protein L18